MRWGRENRLSRGADDPEAGKKEKAKTGTFAADLIVLKKMLPYLWPKNQKLLRVQVVAAMLLLIAAKVFTVATPVTYKYSIDDLAQRFSLA